MGSKILNRALRLIYISRDPTDQEKALVEEIEDLLSTRVLSRIQAKLPEIVDVPESLDYELVEAIIYRFNRIGSEGMTKESVEGHEAVYEDKALDHLMEAVDAWVEDNMNPPGAAKRVRFL